MSNKSFDLLNVSGKKKTLEDLINPTPTQDQKSIDDIPALLTAAESKKTFPIGPPSDILSRVQAFLPQLKSANEQLKAADPKNLDIENVDEEAEQYIEMNLGLGVYEQKIPGQSDSEEDMSEEEEIEEEKDSVLPNTTKNPLIQEVKK